MLQAILARYKYISLLALLFTFSQITSAEVSYTTSILGNENGKLLTYQSPNDSWKIGIGGHLQLDVAKYFDDDPPSLKSGFEVRRGRLYMNASFLKEWLFRAQYDFTVFDDDDPDAVDGFNDLFLKYSGFNPVSLYMGNFKNTVSLEQMTSSTYFTFMERALPNALMPGRNLGFGVKSYGKKWSAAAGVYGGTLPQPSNDGHGVSGRATFSPIHETGDIIHMGISSYWRSSDDDDSVKFKAPPESHVTDTRLVDTGSFDTEDYYGVVFETALIKGPFALQGEYMWVDVNRKIDSNPDADFNGYYVEGSWFLTGESRNYYFKEGMFKSVKPLTPINQGGMGAWKLAARYSNIDLTDKDINGGEEDNFTFSLSWYPTVQTRVIAEYINVLDVNGGKNDGVEPHVFQMRAQIYW